jgi:secretion/DNA translocation related TadE-like protein
VSAVDRDGGSASVWALSLAMVLWVCVAAVVLAGGAVIARHRAATAADMAALAAASVIGRSEMAGESAGESTGDPGGRACAAANAIALANDATVTSCQVVGQVVDVTTTVRVPALRVLTDLGLDSVSARARAGPA